MKQLEDRWEQKFCVTGGSFRLLFDSSELADRAGSLFSGGREEERRAALWKFRAGKSFWKS